MQLFIKMLTGKTLTIDVDCYKDSCRAIKEKISAIERIPLDQQRLVFFGKEVENSKILGEPLRRENLLHLIQRLPKLENFNLVKTFTEDSGQFKLIYQVGYLDENKNCFDSSDVLQLYYSENFEAAYASYQKRRLSAAQGQMSYLALVAIPKEVFQRPGMELSKIEARSKYSPADEKLREKIHDLLSAHGTPISFLTLALAYIGKNDEKPRFVFTREQNIRMTEASRVASEVFTSNFTASLLGLKPAAGEEIVVPKPLAIAPANPANIVAPKPPENIVAPEPLAIVPPKSLAKLHPAYRAFTNSFNEAMEDAKEEKLPQSDEATTKKYIKTILERVVELLQESSEKTDFKEAYKGEEFYVKFTLSHFADGIGPRFNHPFNDLRVHAKRIMTNYIGWIEKPEAWIMRVDEPEEALAVLQNPANPAPVVPIINQNINNNNNLPAQKYDVPKVRMQLFIKTLTSKSLVVEVDKDESCLTIKEKILKQEKIPIDEQNLIFCGKMVPDNAIIKEMHFESAACVHLIQRLPKLGDPVLVEAFLKNSEQFKLVYQVGYLDENKSCFDSSNVQQLYYSENFDAAYASYQKRALSGSQYLMSYLALVAIPKNVIPTKEFPKPGMVLLNIDAHSKYSPADENLRNKMYDLVSYGAPIPFLTLALAHVGKNDEKPRFLFTREEKIRMAEASRVASEVFASDFTASLLGLKCAPLAIVPPESLADQYRAFTNSFNQEIQYVKEEALEDAGEDSAKKRTKTVLERILALLENSSKETNFKEICKGEEYNVQLAFSHFVDGIGPRFNHPFDGLRAHAKKVIKNYIGWLEKPEAWIVPVDQPARLLLVYATTLLPPDFNVEEKITINGKEQVYTPNRPLPAHREKLPTIFAELGKNFQIVFLSNGDEENRLYFEHDLKKAGLWEIGNSKCILAGNNIKETLERGQGNIKIPPNMIFYHARKRYEIAEAAAAGITSFFATDATELLVELEKSKTWINPMINLINPAPAVPIINQNNDNNNNNPANFFPAPVPIAVPAPVMVAPPAQPQSCKILAISRELLEAFIARYASTDAEKGLQKAGTQMYRLIMLFMAFQEKKFEDNAQLPVVIVSQGDHRLLNTFAETTARSFFIEQNGKSISLNSLIQKFFSSNGMGESPEKQLEAYRTLPKEFERRGLKPKSNVSSDRWENCEKNEIYYFDNNQENLNQLKDKGFSLIAVNVETLLGKLEAVANKTLRPDALPPLLPNEAKRPLEELLRQKDEKMEVDEKQLPEPPLQKQKLDTEKVKIIFIDHGGVLDGEILIKPPQSLRDKSIIFLEDKSEGLYQLLPDAEETIKLLNELTTQHGYLIVFHSKNKLADQSTILSKIQAFCENKKLKCPTITATAVADSAAYPKNNSQNPAITQDPNSIWRGTTIIGYNPNLQECNGKSSLREAVETYFEQQKLEIDKANSFVLDDGLPIYASALKTKYYPIMIGKPGGLDPNMKIFNFLDALKHIKTRTLEMIPPASGLEKLSLGNNNNNNHAFFAIAPLAPLKKPEYIIALGVNNCTVVGDFPINNLLKNIAPFENLPVRFVFVSRLTRTRYEEVFGAELCKKIDCPEKTELGTVMQLDAYAQKYGVEKNKIYFFTGNKEILAQTKQAGYHNVVETMQIWEEGTVTTSLPKTLADLHERLFSPAPSKLPRIYN